MSDAQSVSPSSNGWDEFWFAPWPANAMAQVRGVLCLITASYFLSSWSDAPFWYTDGGPLSVTRVSTFLQTGGLESEARWILSPLFLSSSAWIYRLYLAVGIAAIAALAIGRQRYRF